MTFLSWDNGVGFVADPALSRFFRWVWRRKVDYKKSQGDERGSLLGKGLDVPFRVAADTLLQKRGLMQDREIPGLRDRRRGCGKMGLLC